MSTSIEQTILVQLIHDHEYAQKVLPFLKDDYFQQIETKTLFQQIRDFIQKYHVTPTYPAIKLSLDGMTSLSEANFKSTGMVLEGMEQVAPQDQARVQWLLDQTETFCQEQAIRCALVQAIEIMDGKPDNKHALVNLMQDALAVSFDHHVGHDYVEDVSERHTNYTNIEKRIPFDLEYMNKITNGGLTPKTINIVVAGTGVGKSIFLCHVAAATLTQGKNVVYITAEMSEEKIAQRIDANLLNINHRDVPDMPKAMFLSKFEAFRERTTLGKLIIKEYPTCSGHVGHFRHLLNELRLKKSFVPDLVIVDYLNICASSRFKPSMSASNQYAYVKAIAEELRGLAVEFKIPILTATQLNREGATASDPNIGNTSESFGVPMSADLMFVLVASEDETAGKIMVKQLKNRYADDAKPRKFWLGLDKDYMRFSNIENAEYIADSNNEESEEATSSPSVGGRKSTVGAQVRRSIGRSSRG